MVLDQIMREHTLRSNHAANLKAEAELKSAMKKRGLSKYEGLLVIGGKAYACREIPLPSNMAHLNVPGHIDFGWEVPEG